MNYNTEIQTALDKEIENVALLSAYSFKKLDELLAVVKQKQMVAFRNQLTDAGALLQIWERQLSDARLLKLQYEVTDNNSLEVAMSLPDLDAYEMIEKRQQFLLEKLLVKESIEK